MSPARPPLDLLFVLAHPDDETFGLGGLLAWAHAQGHRTGLVCATRGEAGAISDASLGTPETLGAVRELELRKAMRILDLHDLRVLSYRDSGMAGADTNGDPRSLVQAPADAVEADVVAVIRDTRPAVVITFGADGIYGHPDHIRIGEAADRAVEVAASDELPFLGESWAVTSLYHCAVAREDLFKAKAQGGPFFSRLSDEEIATMGSPAGDITHAFDVSPYIPVKLEAIRAHATQLPYRPEPGSAGDPAMRPRLGKESLIRMPLPWDQPGQEPDVLDRFAQAAAVTAGQD